MPLPVTLGWIFVFDHVRITGTTIETLRLSAADFLRRHSYWGRKALDNPVCVKVLLPAPAAAIRCELGRAQLRRQSGRAVSIASLFPGRRHDISVD